MRSLLTLSVGVAWRGYVYTAECSACHHRTRVDLKKLADRLGDDFPLKNVRTRLRCGRCRSRRCTISLLDKTHALAVERLERWPFEYD